MSPDVVPGTARSELLPVRDPVTTGRRLEVDVSIVSGLNQALTVQCLESLLGTAGDDRFDLRVTVTCNTPGSTLASRLRKQYPGVRVLENQSVKGFAANHNVVLRASTADYVLVLNDDLIFRPGAVAAAIEFLERPENQGVGTLTPRLLNPDGTLQPCTFSFPTVTRVLLAVSGIRDRIPTTPRLYWLARLLRRSNGRSRFWEHDRVCDVETFAGAAMFVRGRALRDVGVLDETTQVGGEETEWHRRFWERGWRVVFYPGAEVVHLGSQTVGRDPSLDNEFFKGALNYFRLHGSAGAYLGLLVSSAALFGFRRALAVVRGDRERAGRAAVGWRTALAWLRAGRSHAGTRV